MLSYLCIQAYPWFVSLIVEHSEKFWTLFGASMDSILKQQPKDNWDSFPLFQIINDYLITDGEIFTLSPKERS